MKVFPHKLRTYQAGDTLLNQGIAVGLSVLLGATLGLAVAHHLDYVQLFALGAVGLAVAWLMIRFSPLTVILFWIAYALFSTMYKGDPIQGLFYPFYILMLVNIFIALLRGQLRVPWRQVSIYFLFYGVVLFGLSKLAIEPNLNVWQNLFIYGLGLLVLFQFSSTRSLNSFLYALIGAGVIISGWMIVNAAQGGFGYRGYGDSQNGVAVLVSLGVVALLAKLLAPDNKATLLTRIGMWMGCALGGYAMLLLASRGITIALAVAVLAMLSRVMFRPKVVISWVAGVGILAMALANLPGSEGLINRFSSPDVMTANGRTMLWEIAIREFLDSSPGQMLLGQGFYASRILLLEITNRHSSTHNAYLLMLVEFGVIGLGLFVALHLIIMWSTWRLNSALGFYAFGAITLLLFSSLTLNMANNFIYWVVLGHGLAISARSSNLGTAQQQPAEDVSQPLGYTGFPRSLKKLSDS